MDDTDFEEDESGGRPPGVGALSQIGGSPTPEAGPSKLQMASQNLRDLTERKRQLAELEANMRAAAEREAQAYESPINIGMDPGLIALGSSIATEARPMVGLSKGLQGMAEARQKLAERDWARKTAAEKVRAGAERDVLELRAKGVSRPANAIPHIREYTNEKGERVQTSTDPVTGEITQTILGKTQGRAGELPKLKAGFQWVRNPDGTHKLDELGLPVQAKITTLPVGTVPGSVTSKEIPEKGWGLYKDDSGNFFRINQNAGLVQKQTENGWETTEEMPGDVKRLGSAGGASAMNQRFAGRVIGASNEGLAALATIAGMGDPNTGMFGSKLPGNIFSRAGAGILSPEQAKRYNATIAGLAVEIATAQNQGMVPNESQIKHVEDAITIQPTDDDTTKKYRVALAARYLEKALETAGDLASSKQVESIERIRKNLKEFPDPNEILNLKPEKHMFKGEGAVSKDENVLSKGPVNIYSDADYDALPSGTVFLPPGGGKPRRKP